MIRDALIRGIDDNEIHLDVLGNSKQMMSLEETLQLVEAKESGKRSAGRLFHGNPIPTAAATSSYKRQEKGRTQQKVNTTKLGQSPCGYCRRLGHGHARQERISKCPAYNHTCTKCGILHHHEKVCHKSQRQEQPVTFNQPSLQSNTAAVFETLCSIDTQEPMSAASSPALDHHIYNEICDIWEKRTSDPQPLLNVTVQAFPSHIHALNINLALKTATAPVKYLALADTGYQSCLAGLPLLQKLGLQVKHFIQTTMQMTAANNNRIRIVGALMLRISGLSITSKKTISTCQTVYVTDSTDKLFLSKQACVAFQILLTTFPTTGIASASASTSEESTTLPSMPPSATALPPLTIASRIKQAPILQSGTRLALLLRSDNLINM
ncbi:retrovirus-related pol polyprotein from [Plakobranchus ocellatus]|uniref:Retrovirus-related pol polyprotein from n=1 Tax=Plakobranchus ocellatus TaxID=259542 RepID=A0AAV4A8U1_9GAST|nr:retrovirus-related pol polyprotein from [Plakobranchus ocellatus]